METEKALVEKSPTNIKAHFKPGGGLIPTDLDQLWRLAVMMSRSGMMPKGIQTPEAIAVCVQMGLEVGLSPMSAVQNIAPINGRPSIWGDAVLGLVRASGLLEDFDEQFDGEGDDMIAICTAKRKDQKSVIIRTFSVADAKLAKLWEKKSKEGYPSPWILYPKRMLQMRARSWALRDGFGDVIKGLRVAEEVIDMVTANGKSFEAGGDPIANLNEKIKKVDEAQEIATEVKNELKEDLYKAQEVEKKEEKKEDKEDPIRAAYIKLKKTGFKPYVEANLQAIGFLAQEYQTEIRAKWKGFYPDEPFPVPVLTKPVEKVEEAEVPFNMTADRLDDPKTETDSEKFFRLVDGAEDNVSGPALECPETNKGIRVLRSKCEGNCNSREGCPSWTEYDKK